MVVALSLTAGLMTGAIFDLFVLTALSAPFFLAIVVFGAPLGIVGAVGRAFASVGLLQFGFMLGLAARCLYGANSIRPMDNR